jgi:hypothetical protein
MVKSEVSIYRASGACASLPKGLRLSILSLCSIRRWICLGFIGLFPWRFCLYLRSALAWIDASRKILSRA